MTTTQVAYLNALEDRRHNYEMEDQGRFQLREVQRSNIAKEQENVRSNRASERLKAEAQAEQARSNYVNERIRNAANLIALSHNEEMERQNLFAVNQNAQHMYRQDELQRQYNAEVRRSNQAQELLKQRQQEIDKYRADIQKYQADIQNANSQAALMQAQASLRSSEAALSQAQSSAVRAQQDVRLTNNTLRNDVWNRLNTQANIEYTGARTQSEYVQQSATKHKVAQGWVTTVTNSISNGLRSLFGR